MKSILFFVAASFIYAQSLTNISSWGYWLNNLNVEELANSPYELLVIDYSKDGSDENKLTPAEVSKIKVGNKTVISYISIGEAEDYRLYWDPSWADNPPAWLGPENPDWAGNYKVRYWMPEWQNIIFRYIDTIMAQGFDGIYMDIIDAYEYWKYENPEEPKADSLMLDFILKIRQHIASKTTKTFYMLPQNGELIINETNVDATMKGKFFQAINGIGVEDVFFPGDLPENNPYNPSQDRLNALTEFMQNGKQVFSVEYLTNSQKIAKYKDEAQKYGFVPYVCTRELDKLCYENVQENKVIIYPNPSSEPYLNLYYKKFPFDGLLSVKIYDTLGRLIYYNEVYSNTISEYLEIPQGVYLIKIETNDFSDEKKWIITGF